jgi:membrane protease YdiL (CAAX protease family)
MDKNLKEVGKFILLAYGISWILWTPAILNALGIIDFSFRIGIIGTFGPIAAALILTFSSKGKEGVLGLLRRSFSGRFNKIWWLVAIILWPALQGISMLMAVYLGGDTAPEIPLFSEPLSLLPGLLFTFFLGGALGEEMGWRGYALDRLQNKNNALVSSLILGVIWAFWHLPLYLWPAASGREGMPFALFFLNVLIQTPIYTWLYNNTKRSLWPVMIFHCFQNNVIFNIFNMNSGVMYFGIVFLLAVILIVVIWKPKNLVREKNFERVIQT